MNGRAYYNEIDPAAGAVLRELIARNVIVPGDVDDRSIKDVQAGDLAGYTQCHFFAGGGLWSVAARLAGWPDTRGLWTGSCPCQPFSAAGKGLGTDDPRHLWPDFHRLISACRPAVVMGEQVAGAAGYGWFDGVSADLAVETYACRAVDIPACSIDAPHQRNRLYWVANLVDPEGIGRRQRWPEHELRSRRHTSADADVQLQSDADCGGCTGWAKVAQRQPEQRAASEWTADGVLAYAAGDRRQVPAPGQQPAIEGPQRAAHSRRNGSWWSDAEWIVSPLDGKARRAKPGIPFLVDGLPGRVDLWRVGGNAISPVLATEVIAAFLESERALP